MAAGEAVCDSDEVSQRSVQLEDPFRDKWSVSDYGVYQELRITLAGGVRCEMMSRNKIVVMVILSAGSVFAIAGSLLYSYACNTVWYLGPRTAVTPPVVVIPIICAVDVIASICLVRK
jgi:hypothetical protein